MNIYKLKIKLKSSYITPWQSDTIFGSICWAFVQYYGESILNNFLKEYDKGNYPFVVSDGFPGDFFPKPIVVDNYRENSKLNKSEAIEVAIKAKKTKKTNFVTLQEFNAIINDGQVELSLKEKNEKNINVMHNQISRITDTTDTGNLFEQNETFSADHTSIYLGLADNWKENIFKAIELFSERGFGKRASVGKGHFSIIDLKPFSGFEISSMPNSFITLSNYIPRKNDPIQGQYKTFVKYGKMGQNFAHTNNPFKAPVLMIKPGAVFWTINPKYAYGRLVKNVSPLFEKIVQCGCSLTIPSRVTLSDLG